MMVGIAVDTTVSSSSVKIRPIRRPAITRILLFLADRAPEFMEITSNQNGWPHEDRPEQRLFNSISVNAV
ncbi:hypothetical protein D3C72_2348960 [compost metagenome]